MRDMHCHILPGVDDGAYDLQESVAMLKAAKQVGITEIVCTPHAREPYFDYNAMWDAFELLLPKAQELGLKMSMGFEVNHTTLMDLGYAWIDNLAFDQTDEFLLELPTRCAASDFTDYERSIFEIQSRGYTVIIAHPERYHAIQDDIAQAERLARLGCKLQASCDFIAGGRMGAEKKPAKRLFKAGLYDYIGSDAHKVEHYANFAKAIARFADDLNEPLE